MFKTLLASLALVSLTVPSVHAQTYDDYVTLAETIASIGVSVKINPPKCDNVEALGWYNGNQRELVVCQENRVKGSTQEVNWTAEDWDTFLHEAHHVVQDCMDDRIDNNLRHVYSKPLSFSLNVLGATQVGQIIEGYSTLDVGPKINEIEAFAVARLNDPQEQTRDVKNYCM